MSSGMDIASLLQSLATGTIPASQLSTGVQEQQTQAPSIGDLISSIMGQPIQNTIGGASSSAPSSNGGDLQSILAQAIQSQGGQALNAVKLSSAPQSVLPSAGALNQAQVPLPPAVQAMIQQQKGVSQPATLGGTQ